MKKEPVTKKLMLELIYPAVLGAILYQLLDTIKYLANGRYSFDALIKIKLALLVISIIFYICDYLYIMFTTRYIGWFFACDIIFLLTLYATVVAIDIDKDSQGGLPHNKFILLFYLIFLFFYWLWDRYEYNHAPEGREKDHFLRVVKWEVFSMLVTGGFLVICWLFWNDHYSISIITILILLVVTVPFVFLVNRKREFAR